MKTTPYFHRFRLLSKQFDSTNIWFENMIKTSISTYKNQQFFSETFGDKNFVVHTIDKIDSDLKILKQLKVELITLNAEVSNRGAGFFKHGNIKQKLNHVLNVEEVNRLKVEMKECRQNLEKVIARKKW